MTACLRELRCSVSPANRPLAVNSITVVLPRILLARMSGLAAPHTRSLFKGCRAIHEYANDSVRLNVAVCPVLDWPRTEMCGWRCYRQHVECTYRSLFAVVFVVRWYMYVWTRVPVDCVQRRKTVIVVWRTPLCRDNRYCVVAPVNECWGNTSSPK